MDNIELENEIELKMNPQDFSLSTRDLIDIMNQYGLSEHDVAFAYSEIVTRKREELEDTTKEVVTMFREKGNYYPSFNEFKKMFNQYDGHTFVDDNILRDMHKKETQDANQTSMFEIREMIKEQFRAMSEDEDFERDAAVITKQWGGETKKAPDAMLSPEDIFDLADAGAVAKQDIQGEFGDDEFTPMTDDEYKNIMNDLNEDGEIGQKGLFKPKDAEGNDINRGALVKPVNNEVDKKGRVTGFGDDGKGNMIIIVDYQWPIDLKFMNSKEMGTIREYPQDIIIQTKKQKNMNELNNDINNKNPNDLRSDGVINGLEDILKDYKSGIIDNTQELQDIINNYFISFNKSDDNERANHVAAMKAKYPDMYDDGIEEARGLGHTVKNNGDRNVKKSKDNSHAPVTTLPEGKTLDAKIKTLSEGTLKKKDLMSFIKEEAKNFAKDIKKK